MAGTTKVEAYPADRDRLNQLAAQLTSDGPGRFGQAETLKWLLDTRETWTRMMTEQLLGPPQGNNERTGIAWNE